MLLLALSGCGVNLNSVLEPGRQGQGRVLQGNGIVVVSPGDSGYSIGRKLEEAGVTSADHFSFLSQRDPEAVYVQPGTYRLDTGISAEEALAQLIDGQHKDPGLVVPEGLRAQEVFALVAERLRVPVADVERAASELESQVGTLEGYLFPATYDIDGLDPRNALSLMRTRFDEDSLNDIKDKARDRGMTLNELVTVASIIQVEVAPEDYAKAARTIYNRLEVGMPLQLDSTINYATGKRTVSPTTEDLSVDSPYNTYRFKGLPPTPISNPGEDALRAALKPQAGDWLYWVTVDLDAQRTEFAVTEGEFLKYKEQFRQWLRENP